MLDISSMTGGAGTTSAELAQKSKSQLLKSAGEFESILLSQWLQGAEDSFGTVPGADEDHDAAEDQMKNFAVQALAKAFTQAGGIGISQMVSKALARHVAAPAAAPTAK